jgi:hypothetical protein
MSFKPQVMVAGNGDKWGENNLAFATHDEALKSARDLMNRWYLVTDYRAVESDQPVNYRLDDEGTLHEVKP